MKRFALTASLLILFQSAAFAIGTAYSGTWYNPEQSGHGFSLEYTILNDGTPLVVAYWYVYDTDGNPIFLVGVGEPEENNSVTLDFDAPYGMKFGDFDPNEVVHGDGGTGVFTFDNPESGTFVYEPSNWIASTYGISAITTDMVKLIDVAHPNPEIVEVHIGALLLTTTDRTGDFPVCFNGAGELLPCASGVEPPPNEPVPLLGLWSGRMVYDRAYAGAGTCYDADVLVNVSKYLGNTPGLIEIGDVTVSRDGGSFDSDSPRSNFIENNYVVGYFYAFGIKTPYTLQFNDYGQASGAWREDSGSKCFGTWSLSKN